MTRPSTREPRHASSAQQRSSGDDSPGDSRLLAIGSLGAVLLSTVASGVAYGLLPDLMRIHWTLGMGPYYGPEFAPTTLVLTAFPLLVAVSALGAHWGGAQLSHSEAFAAIRPYYVVAAFGTFLSLIGTQIALVIVNA